MAHVTSVRTRFRAYQLGQAGSSFSYFAGNHFTLIEAVVTDTSRQQLLVELTACGKTTIDVLHITSWDQDHCDEPGLNWILTYLAPAKIEYPGYDPHTECGKACLEAIAEYRNRQARKSVTVKVQGITPTFISGLADATSLSYNDIFYHPKTLRPNSNDNSTIKFFRGGCFNVLSLGDVEDPAIAALLKRCSRLRREVDVMILAHHGADNGFTTKALLEILKPQVAVCTSNYDNEYDHPRQEIRDILHEQGIRLFTTKTGDVMINSLGGHSRDFRVTNFRANNDKVSSQYDYKARKHHWLSMNADTLRSLANPGFRGLK